jgi:hypothetical protein
MTDLVIDFDRSESRQFLYSVLKDLKGEQVIKIKKRSKGRSLQENRYYWSVVLAYIADYTGHNPNQVHEYYKHELIPLVKFTDDYRLTTSDLTHDQIWDFIDKIRLDAKDKFNISIPDPDGVIL